MTQHGTSDLLNGLAAIGAEIGLGSRQVQYMHDKGELPTFKLGARVCARRSELEAHFARVSAEARGPARRVKADAAGRAGAALAPAPGKTASSTALLYGHRAIASHLGLPVADVARMDVERRLPTYWDDGCTVASTAALDHWNGLKGGGHAGK